MQLDKLIIALRQRNPWEAMDLGVKVMRAMWPAIFFPWLLLISIVLVFCVFAESQGYLYFATIFMWWIKPVYESMILYVLSRGIFGEYPTTSEIYSSMGDWLKTGILTSVLFWRLSPSRSFNMPVHMLEGLKGQARKNRLLSLHRVTGSHAMGITIIGIHFEYVLLLTFYALIFFIAPDTTNEYLESLGEESNSETYLFVIGTIIYATIIFILEPFYVAAGFMLYLNRRTQLEAWDVELDFRKLASRIDDQQTQAPRESKNA